MAWLEFASAVAACAILIGAPGFLVAHAIRLRGLWAVAASPAIGVCIVAIASLVAQLLGLVWNPLLLAAVAGGIVTITWCTVRIGRRSATNAAPSGWRWAPLLGVGLGVLLMTGRFLTAVPAPTLFAQIGDNVFHLNAVRAILDGADASPLGFGFDHMDFYPSGWHAIVSLVALLSGVSVPIASNATLYVVVGLVWPLGAVLITRTLFGTGTALTIAAGTLSAGFAVYPLMLIPYMGTYPLVGSIALLPVALAAAIEFIGIGRAHAGRLSVGLALLFSLPAVGVMHPSALIMLVVLALPATVVVLLTHVRSHPDRRRLVILTSILASAGVLTVLVFVRPNITQPDSWRGSTGQSVGEILTGSFNGLDVAVVVAALTVFGIVVAVRRGGRPEWSAVGAWIILAMIYLAAAGPDEFVRLVLAGPWYSDATRIAAFIPIASLPLAALGAQSVWALVLRRTSRWRAADSRFAALALSAVFVVLFSALVIQSSAVRSVDIWMRKTFEPSDNGLTVQIGLDIDDRALIDKVSETVPGGDLLATNPRDGSGFAYALTGRPVLVPHLLAQVSQSQRTFMDQFSTSAPDGHGCTAARELGVEWVLDLHPNPLRPDPPGLQNLDDSPNVELAYRVGDSSLYKITGCGIG